MMIRGAAFLVAILANAACTMAATVPAPQTFEEAPPVDESVFPPGPEKGFILATCQTCHSLGWVVRSGGSTEGWSSRLVRMIRAGAPLTREQIPALAAYLAKAFPERPLPARDGAP